MLQPRLTNCLDCTDITKQLDEMDCKLAHLGYALYGNTVLMLNNSISASDIIDLLVYKRILIFRQKNPDYCSCESNNKTNNVTTTIYSNPEDMGCCDKIIKYGISSDVEFANVLPAKLNITTVTIDNLSNNGFQLIIKLTDDTEIFNEYIDALGLLTLTLNTPIRSLTGIKITSPAWNGANINLSITVQNPF